MRGQKKSIPGTESSINDNVKMWKCTLHLGNAILGKDFGKGLNVKDCLYHANGFDLDSIGNKEPEKFLKQDRTMSAIVKEI